MAHQYANGLADGFLLSPRRHRAGKRGGRVRGKRKLAPVPAPAPTHVHVKDIAAEFLLKSPHRRVLREAGFEISGDPMTIPAAQAAALRVELSQRLARSDEYPDNYLVGILHNRVQFRMNEFDARNGPVISMPEILGCVPPDALRKATSLGKELNFIHKSAVEDTVAALQELVNARLKQVAIATTATARQENAEFMMQADLTSAPVATPALIVPEPEPAPATEPAAPVRWGRHINKSGGTTIYISGTQEWFDRLAQYEADQRAKLGRNVQIGKIVHDAIDAAMNGNQAAPAPVTDIMVPAPAAPSNGDRMAVLNALGQLVEEAIDRKLHPDVLRAMAGTLLQVNADVQHIHAKVFKKRKSIFAKISKIRKRFSLRS